MSPTHPPTRTLTSILVECGIVTDAQVEQALARQVETGLMIGETLVELGFTTEDNIGWALSKQLGFPYADVKAGSVDQELVRRFPESLLRRVQAVPLFGTSEEITVAMADPTDVDAVSELQAAAARHLSLVIGGPASIRRALDSIYGPSRPARPDPALGRGPTPSPPLSGRRDVVWDRAGTNFLAFHLHAASRLHASEIHFIPRPGELTVAYRTDAGLTPQASEQPETSLYLRARLGVLGVPDLDPDAGLEAWGAAAVDAGAERIAVSACHTRTGEGVATVLHLSPAPAKAPDLATIGLSPIGEGEIREFIDGPEGLILVTGPPRSGGSMVLASLAATASRADRRTLVLERTSITPYADDAIRVQVRSDAPAGLWERLAVGLGADIVVLDGILAGTEIERVLDGAAVGRLVLARTDWLEPQALRAFLARSRNGRAALRDRPFAVIALPAARREGAAVWADPETTDVRAGSLEVTLLSDEERAALWGAGAGAKAKAR